MRWLAFLSTALAVTAAPAQFDVGLSFGAFVYDLSYRSDDDSRGSQNRDYTSAQAFPTTFTLFYREHSEKIGSFGAELMYKRMVFSTHSSSSGHSTSGATNSDCDCGVLLLGIVPEVRLSAGAGPVLRYGLQFPLARFGNVHSENIAIQGGSDSTFTYTVHSASKEDVPGSLQLFLGVGQRFVIGEHGALSLDTYASLGLFSSTRSNEFGLRLAYAWLRPGRGLWPSLRSHRPAY